jgi:hypothetical protein
MECMIDGQDLFSIVTAALNDLATCREFAGSFEAHLPILTLTVVKVLSGSGEPGKAGSAENGEEGIYGLLDCHRSLDVSERTHGRG